jgi:NTP pyrophosphatase (non-canonical NTP hydrolase)
MTDDIKTDYYQFRAMETASPDSTLTTAALGLCGEAGEFADTWKKILYHGHAFDKDALLKEASDIFWYLALACTKLDVKMSDVMQLNLDKLAGRYKGGAFTAAESINRPEYLSAPPSSTPAPPEKKECSPECACRARCAESAQPPLTRHYDPGMDRYGLYRKDPEKGWVLVEWEEEPTFAPGANTEFVASINNQLPSWSGIGADNKGHVGIADRDGEFLHVDLSSEGIPSKPGDEEWVYDFYAGTWLHYVYRDDDAWELAGEYVDIEAARKAAAKKRSLLSRIFRRP